MIVAVEARGASAAGAVARLRTFLGEHRGPGHRVVLVVGSGAVRALCDAHPGSVEAPADQVALEVTGGVWRVGVGMAGQAVAVRIEGELDAQP